MHNFFGNIITKGTPDVDRRLFNVVDSKDKIVEGIPTLVIGLENARNSIDGFNILDKKYGFTRWTYSKTERRCDYEDDLELFVSESIKSGLNCTKYTYVDFIGYGFDTIRKLIDVARNGMKKTVFLIKGSSFMFVYIEEYKTVLGVSLSLCEYIGIPKKKIFRLLSNAEYVHDTSFIDDTLRKCIGENTHFIPVLYRKVQNIT